MGQGFDRFASLVLSPVPPLASMATLRLVALALHVLGVSLWLGGALSTTRVAAAADHEQDPKARAALIALSRKLLSAVCAPWMIAAMTGAVSLLVLGPPRRVRLLALQKSFWLEVVAGVLLYVMQRALERRVKRLAHERLPEPSAAPVADPESDDPSVKSQPVREYVPVHAAPLRRVQRVILVLSVLATVAALARR